LSFLWFLGFESQHFSDLSGSQRALGLAFLEEEIPPFSYTSLGRERKDRGKTAKEIIHTTQGVEGR